ncbi:MAG: putative Ig domain-containing protein [Archangiaceae bacterium]|nr:putative Ig domain-containing protein [Archangiaceae bacterium]
MTTTKLAIIVALFAAQTALAQNYIIQSQTTPYVGITGGTAVTASQWVPHDPLYDGTDEGYYALTLPFTFRTTGQPYTTVNLESNGFVTFGQPCNLANGDCFSTRIIPSTTTTMHNLIAPFWVDLDVSFGTGKVLYKTSATQVDIEYKNVESFAGFGDTLTFKLTLTSSGVFQIHYGPASTSNGDFYDASTGFENSTGAMGAQILSCGAACEGTDFVPNKLFTIGQPVQPDLIVEQVNLNSVQKTGSNLTLAIAPTFRNFGQNPTGNFLWKAYLSTDRTYQAGTDTLILTATTPLSAAGGAAVSGSAMATIAAPPNGNYYVIVEADSANTVVEGTFGETNNFGATTNYFTSGIDLVATGITGPANSGPGNSVTLHTNWFNQGTDSAGTVGFRIYLSTDNVWSTTDFQLYPATGDATKTIAGGQTVSEDITFAMPQNVPGGDFFYILKINTGMPPVVESATNNTIASTGKVNIRQADLVIKSVNFVDVATGVPVRNALFNGQGRVQIVASNEGGADARNFKVGVVISSDNALSLLNDTLLIESPVTQLLQSTTQTFDITFDIPVNDRGNHPFMTGNYFFFGLLDSGGVITELNEFNNNMMVMQPVLVQSPAPDLTVVRFDAPSAVGVGEVVPVFRVFKNIGNLGAPEVKYRYFVSANAQVTTDDIPLQIISGTMLSDSGKVTLTAGSTDTKTEMVQMPPNLTPGTYYLGAVVDSEGAVTELDETNNGLGSLQVAVAASALRVVTSALPDAVLGRPYSFQLTAAGEAPGASSSWVAAGLPMGMSLSTGGLLTGMPAAETVTGVTFTVTNQGHNAVRLLALRVLPTTTQVEITTPSLPALVNSTTLSFETYLGAAGGVKPYSWRQVPVAAEVSLANVIGLTLDPTTGKLSGFPKTGLVEKAYPITLEVRDSLGTTSTRQFNLRVVAPGAIIFTNLAIPDGLVGISYLSDISVKNFDMSPLSKPLVYRLVAGALPAGLEMVVEQDILLLQGTPTVAGSFAFTIEVEDSKGRNDAADFLLRIYPSNLKVGVNGMPEQFHPGDSADFNFVVSGGTGVKFKLFSGALPPGTSMTTDGHVSGTIDAADTEGTYNFVVEADDATGASGLGAFSVLVKREPVKTGCSAAPATGALWFALALLPLLFKRRRLAGVLATVALALPFAASAQTYQLSAPTPITYASLTAATTVTAPATVNVPFTWKYYGVVQPTVTMSQYGYLTISANANYQFNSGVPHSSSSVPANFIAPWWDALVVTSPAQLRYQQFGTAPNRYLVFEWSNVAASTATAGMRFSFEAILYEGTDEIRFAYGPAAPGTSPQPSEFRKRWATASRGCRARPPSWHLLGDELPRRHDDSVSDAA